MGRGDRLTQPTAIAQRRLQREIGGASSVTADTHAGRRQAIPHGSDPRCVRSRPASARRGRRCTGQTRPDIAPVGLEAQHHARMRTDVASGKTAGGDARIGRLSRQCIGQIKRGGQAAR